ncbi:MAG TPA: Lrp/AsnC family transcriptional regulator [Propionibacteriaceae bacterium]|nr:Lrp/AsnC family transcriptional regulator [Propionibacteriaceae bacterium]
MTSLAARVDELDARILHLFSSEPRIGVLEASRRLAVARGTVQARLDRLERNGVVTAWGPRISPAALGYGVTAFVTLEIVQHEGREDIRNRLAEIAEVLECWTVTGNGDLWCRVVAHSNADLQRVLDAMVTDAGVVRSVSLIGLAELIPYRIEPLVLQSRLSAGAKT